MATKYLLIHDTENNVIAVSRLVLNDMQERRGVPSLSAKPVSLSTIKKEGIRILGDSSYFLQVQFEDFRNKYHDKEFLAKVDWFDAVRGLGMVSIDDSLRLPIYACNIDGKKTWFPETACVYYTEKQEVLVRIDSHSYSHVSVIGLTPGTPDTEGWNNIKNQDLAFRCNEKGDAINGLFTNNEAGE